VKITTVRHGQTLWNTERRIQGQTDIALDDVGLQQAQKLGQRLANEQIDIVYSSDLKRAAKTAEAINKHHSAEFVTTQALRETGFGILEGRLIEEIRQELDNYRTLNQAPPDGESQSDIFSRVQGFLDEVIATHHENIVIVAHHGTIRAIICYFLQIPPNSDERTAFRVGNTAIHCFERESDGKFRMTLENDILHLNEL